MIYRQLRKDIGGILQELCSRKGTYMFIGGRDSEYKATYPQNHSSDFNPDKRAMKYGAELLARYVYDYLKK